MVKATVGTAADLSTPWKTSKPRSLWGDAARTFAQNRAGMAGLVVVVLVLLIAIFAPWIAPYDPLEQDWEQILAPPNADHIMGTDAVGRDLFSRVLMGIRTAVFVALIVTALTTVIGVLVAAMGTLIGGWVDTAVVWIMDALLNFPALWLAAFINVLSRPSIQRFSREVYVATGWAWLQNPVVLDYLVMFGCLSFVWWAGLGRLVRGQVLSLRKKEFIEAQAAVGASSWWITTRHLIPNVLGLVIVQMSTGFGRAMLAESSLSFLGIGIRPPGASLGKMIFDGTATWRSEPHLVLMPGLTLAIIVMAFVFVGDALNDALNPRARER